MRRKSPLHNLAVVIVVFLGLLTVVLTVSFFWVKPLVARYAKSRAETVLLDSANRAVCNILDSEKVDYDRIVTLSRDSGQTVTDLQINIAQINRLKSEISGEVSRIVAGKEEYILKIPVGTLIGNEYTTGFGPRIPFSMQMTATAVVDFKHTFQSAGINQVLHQILIEMKLHGSLLMMGFTESFTVTTTAIAAQTVIVGAVPDSFTNVLEEPGDDIADEIFNYADVN